MKKKLFALAATLFLGGLHGQISPIELADMEFTFMGKIIQYNRIQFVDPSTNAVEQQVDFLWNSHRKVLEAQDSTFGLTSYHWLGSIGSNSNTVALLYGNVMYAENHLYWDQQYRDTLIVDFRDTNNDGALDKTTAFRYHYGPNGIDTAYLYDYSGGTERLALSYVTYRNSAGQTDSLVSYYHMWGLTIPAIAYYYQYTGTLLTKINVVSKIFWDEPLLQAELTLNTTGEITAALISQYDSTTAGWVPESKILFSLESIFAEDEFLARNKVDFYPNPANDWVDIISKTAGVLEILTIDGKTVYKTDFSTDLERHNIDHLAAGAYLIRFSSGSQQRTQTLLKN